MLITHTPPYLDLIATSCYTCTFLLNIFSKRFQAFPRCKIARVFSRFANSRRDFRQFRKNSIVFAITKLLDQSPEFLRTLFPSFFFRCKDFLYVKNFLYVKREIFTSYSQGALAFHLRNRWKEIASINRWYHGSGIYARCMRKNLREWNLRSVGRTRAVRRCSPSIFGSRFGFQGFMDRRGSFKGRLKPEDLVDYSRKIERTQTRTRDRRCIRIFVSCKRMVVVWLHRLPIFSNENVPWYMYQCTRFLVYKVKRKVLIWWRYM